MQGDPSEGVLMLTAGEIVVFHESSGYVFDKLRRGAWVGGVRDFSRRGALTSARSVSHVTGYSLSQESVRKIGRMFPDVVTVMKDTFVRRLKVAEGLIH